MALGLAARIQLLRFLATVVFFHGSEYFLAVTIHGRSRVSLSSLLISKQYAVAMICALLEYKIELVFFPELKENWWMSNIGLLMVIIGEVIRKTAILTARRAFTHTIRVHYENHHQLVTHGIYRFMRHPGYCGFFIWATGTQLMLCNPVCVVAFTMVTWRFFSRRIRYPFWRAEMIISYYLNHITFIAVFSVLFILRRLTRFEEFFLRQFFGSQYGEYARLVPSGLPFIK